MNRTEKSLAALLVLLLLAGGVLVALLLLEDRPFSGPGAADAAITASVEPGSSARTAYEHAQRVAIAWADDARLLSLRGNWTVGNSFPPDAAGWSAIFYSSERHATALIAVTEGQASLIGSSAAKRRPDVTDLRAWQADSGLILESFLEAGGRAFVDAHGEASLVLSLDASDRFRWRAALLAPESGEIFVMQFEPTSGVALQ